MSGPPRHPPRSARCLALAAATLALLLVGPARAELDGDEERFPNDAYPVELRKRVNAAVDGGAHWLLRCQQPTGSWDHRHNASYPMGPTALAVLALLKSGVPSGHPRIERAFAHLRTLPMAKTYSVAVLLMALDAKYGPATDTFAEEEVDRYGNRKVKKPCAEQIEKKDLAWMKEGVAFLVKNQKNGGWRYPRGEFDLSNMQYALLGLKAAARCGVEIPRKVWMSALRFLLDYQVADGDPVEVRVNEVRGDYRIEWTEKAKARGFTYMAQAAQTGSMTTAGIACLLICQSELWGSRRFTGKLRQGTRDAARDAFAWMQKNFSVARNPGGGFGNYHYYLYGLERAGILARARFIGKHDWYEEGASVLLQEQAPDGSWRRQDLVSTCFALLFLKRATFRTQNPAITPRGLEPKRR